MRLHELFREVTGCEHDVDFYFFLFTSLADVSCHVVVALPVPLGQCDGCSALSGHFLRHHPTAPGYEARTDHHPHDR